MSSNSSFTLSCRVVELAARLGPALPLSPIYIQGISTTTETNITANQFQTLLRVNHPRKHPTSNFPRAIHVKHHPPPPSPSQQPLPHLPSLQRQTHPTTTTTLPHQHSSTAARQHDTVPTRRISPRHTKHTHTHAHQTSTHARHATRPTTSVPPTTQHNHTRLGLPPAIVGVRPW